MESVGIYVKLILKKTASLDIMKEINLRTQGSQVCFLPTKHRNKVKHRKVGISPMLKCNQVDLNPPPEASGPHMYKELWLDKRTLHHQ